MSIFDPKIFNVIIVCMFILAALRWAWAGDWNQVAYFVGAVVLNVAVLRMAP